MAHDASRFLYRAARAVDVDVMLNSTGRVLDLQSAPGLETPRKEVNDGSAVIRQFLNEKHLAGKESRKALYQEFEKKIAPLVERAKRETDAAEMGKIESELFEVDNGSDLANLGEKMYSFQESLLKLTRQAIDAKSTYEVLWDEDSGRAIYREDITLTSRQDGLLAEIDASLLKREAEDGNAQFQMLIKNGNNAPELVNDPSHILIEPKTKQVILQYERSTPMEVIPYCNSAPLSTIQRLSFVWPSSGDSVKLGATLAAGDIRLPAWFSLDRTQADSYYVREIQLPEHSFFASRQPLQLSTQDGHDLLTPSDIRLASVRNFGADQGNWIEILQRRWILRRSFVSKYREYFIVENSIAAIVVFLLGAAVTVIFPKLNHAP